MQVLIDMDGVLCDTLPTWLSYYAQLSGEVLYAKDITAYNFADRVARPDLFFRSLEIDQVFRRSLPMPDAVAGFRALCAQHDVYVCSYVHASSPSGFEQKLEWLRFWFPWYDTDRVIFTRQKQLVAGDILVEDSPANITKWLAAHPQGWAYCVEHTYNQGFEPLRCTRVKSIDRIPAFLSQFGAAA